METIPPPVEPSGMPRHRAAGAPEPIGGNRSPLIDALTVLISWRRVVFACVGAVLLVTLIFTLFARPVYLVRVSLLPKQEDTGLMGISNLVANQFGAIAGGMTTTSSTDILVTILESNHMRDRVIERLNLVKVFKVKAKKPERALELAEAKLEKIVSVNLTRRFSIFLEVRAATPQLAADIANAYFDELEKLNREFAFTSARQTRVFIEERLAEARDSLMVSQTKLEEFQRQHGMVSLDDQAKAEVEVASKLEAELMAAEAQLEVQRRYSTGAFSKTRELEFKVTAMKNQLAGIAGSSDPEAARTPGRFLISFSRMPELGRQLGNLMLDVKTQQAIYTLMNTQYQQAKIDEARDIPTIQVLDRARPPQYRDSPRRKQNMVVGLAAGLGLGILLAFLLEYLERALKGSSGARMKRQVGPGLTRLENWLVRLKG
jgi:tyrosine-protein kinase Etk/Wzc